MPHARILGTGSFLPQRIITNLDLEKTIDTSDAWIVERTGIKQRHVITPELGETCTSMAIAAAQQAITRAQLSVQDIDLVLVATCSGDNYFPSTACAVQAALGIKNCPAFDINAACAGFSYALAIANQFIQTQAAKHVLVIGAEVMSRLVDWTDRNTCILFGDGAGAIVLGASSEPGILRTHLHADGAYQALLNAPGAWVDKLAKPFIHMHGSEVFKLAVSKLEESVTAILADAGIAQSELKWLVPHQANLRIIKAIAKKLSLPLEQVIITIGEQGNTSAASVPLALDTAIQDQRIKRGELLLLESFGAGFTWAAALIRY